MESYSITCTTCGTRLTVRDQSLVGQILACPSCNSMVLVEPPQQRMTVGGNASVDSQAITSEAIESAIKEGDSLSPLPLDSAFAGNDEEPSPVLVPPTDWQSTSSRSYRQIGLIGVIALITIVSSVALFGLFVQSTMNEESIARTDTSLQESVDVQPASDAVTDPSNGQSETLPKLTTVDSQPNPAEDPLPENLTNVPSQAVADVDTRPLDPDPRPQPEADTVPADLLPDQGLDRIFGQTDPPEAPKEAGMEAFPDGLKQFSPLFGLGLDNDDQRPPTSKPTPLRFDPPPKDSRRFPSAAPAIDLTRQLSQKFGLDLQQKSMVDAVGLIAEALALPIAMNIESLDSAGIDPRQPLNLRLLDLEASQVFSDLLEPAGCVLQETTPGQLSVAAHDDRVSAFVAPALVLDDLKDRETILKLVTQLAITPNGAIEILLDPASGAIAVQGSADDVWHVAIAAEAVRIGRGLPTRLPNHFTARWLAETPIAYAVPLSAPIQFEGDQALPTTHWLRQLADSQKVSIMIDWINAWQRGFTPTEKILPWASQPSLEAAEHELLDPFGLTIRDLGSGLWIVTTARALEMTAQTVVFKTPVNDADTFIASLAEACGYPDPAQLPAVVDPVSKRLICRLPRFLLTQIADALESQ